jgi:hypothetical protein
MLKCSTAVVQAVELVLVLLCSSIESNGDCVLPVAGQQKYVHNSGMAHAWCLNGDSG